MPGTMPSEPGNQLGAPQLGVGRGVRIAMALGAVLLLIAIVVVGGIVLLGADDESKDTSTDESDTASTTAPADEAPSTLDLPTIDPSDFPTELPPVPSGLPEPPGSPGGLPTEFPDLPTEFPTDSAGWEDWLSDNLEQGNP